MRWRINLGFRSSVKMLSVLIPVYRVDVTQLVSDLHRQCTALKIPFEIRLLDDYSDQAFRGINQQISKHFSDVYYSENPANLGRSITRNILIQEAKFEWLYFLDCDSDVSQNPELILNFWKQKDEHSLFSGGRIYQKNPPRNPAFYLHWLWGSKRELLDPKLRMRDPVNHFLSNNFIIHRSITNKVQFNPQIKGYGYEDTLFAAELISAGFQIKHIENPLIHAGLDSTLQFINKIEESLINIQRIEELCAEKNIQNPLKSKLISTWESFRKFIPTWLVKPFIPILKINLKSKNPSLVIFDLYRLFYLLSLRRK